MTQLKGVKNLEVLALIDLKEPKIELEKVKERERDTKRMREREIEK